MRNIIKKQSISKLMVTVYNTATKEEEELTVHTHDGKYDLPDGCLEISNEVLEVKEKTFKMTPAEFFEHATVVED